jgi:hypothetical protein
MPLRSRKNTLKKTTVLKFGSMLSLPPHVVQPWARVKSGDLTCQPSGSPGDAWIATRVSDAGSDQTPRDDFLFSMVCMHAHLNTLMITSTAVLTRWMTASSHD